MSREWSSSMVTMSEREGLFVPAFCALIVKNVRIVFAGGTAVGGSAGFDMSGSPSGERKMSLCVGPSEEEAFIGSMPCRVGFPEGVGGCPFVGDMS